MPRQVLYTRLFIIGIVALTYLLSLGNVKSVFAMGVWCFSGFSALFPIVFAALYWRGLTAAGAISGIFAAIVSWIVLFYQALQQDALRTVRVEVAAWWRRVRNHARRCDVGKLADHHDCRLARDSQAQREDVGAIFLSVLLGGQTACTVSRSDAQIDEVYLRRSTSRRALASNRGSVPDSTGDTSTRMASRF